MAKYDFSSLNDFAKRLNTAARGAEKQKFYEECCRELAARFLRKVIKRTPVGKGTFEVQKDAEDNPVKYKRGKKAGQVKLKRLTNGGTLRRGWTAGSGNVLSFVSVMKIEHVGHEYHVQITNNVAYASYVEYGHRQTPGRFVPVLGKRLKNGWVKGQFMMTLSEIELAAEAPAILNRKLNKFLREVIKK